MAGTKKNRRYRHKELIPAMLSELKAATTASHQREFQIFRDWICIVEATLEMKPKHLQHLHDHGRVLLPEEEPESVQRLWEQMRVRYDRDWPAVAGHFAQAFALLVDASRRSFNDWLGEIYMAWNISNQWHGQYFSPWEIAEVMAKLSVDANIEQMLYQRVGEALRHPDNALGHALLLSSVLHADDPDQARRFFEHQLVPAALPFVQTLRVGEPCVGSGVMLLAIAAQMPMWANYYGVVRYYGQDIDPTCVKMTKIQLMLYGLNGYGMRCDLAARGALREQPVEGTNGEEVEDIRHGNALLSF